MNKAVTSIVASASLLLLGAPANAATFSHPNTVARALSGETTSSVGFSIEASDQVIVTLADVGGDGLDLVSISGLLASSDAPAEVASAQGTSPEVAALSSVMLGGFGVPRPGPSGVVTDAEIAASIASLQSGTSNLHDVVFYGSHHSCASGCAPGDTSTDVAPEPGSMPLTALGLMALLTGMALRSQGLANP